MIAFESNDMYSNKVDTERINSGKDSAGCSCGKLRLAPRNAREQILFWDILNELSVNIREITRSPNCCWLILWLLVFILLIIICVTQVHSLCATYFSYQSYTTYDITHEKEVPYPLVTLCTEGWMKESAWANFSEEYDLTEQEYIRDHFSQIVGGRSNDMTKQHVEKYDLEHPDKVFDMKEFWTTSHVNLEDLLLACHHGRELMNGVNCTKEFLRSTFYMNGMTCFSMNFTSKMQDIDGYAGALFFIVRNEPFPVGQMCNLDPNLVQEQCDLQLYFIAKHGHYVINPVNQAHIRYGLSAYVSLELTISEALGAPYGDCEEKELKYFPAYSRISCQQEAAYDFMLDCANCSRFGIIPPEYTPVGLDTCTLKDMLRCSEEDKLKELMEQEYRYCPNECTAEHFRTMVDYTNTKPAFVLDALNLTEVTSIGVYHKMLAKTIIAQHPSLTIADLISKVGAALSLWLGFKVMTFLKFFYYSGWEMKRRVTGKP